MSESGLNLFPGLFVGEYDHVLDPQCRVSLPSDWREKDRETELVMIPTRDRALLLIPMAPFMEFVSKAAKKAIANPKMQMALARLGSVSRRCRCDKQGRLPLDKEKLSSIGVKRNLKLIGAYNHIRICAPENWSPPEDLDDSLNEIQQVSDQDEFGPLGNLLKGAGER